MKTWLNKKWKSAVTRRLLAPALALLMVGSFAGYEFAGPVAARATISPAAAPLPDSSVSALLSLDQAMETLAARVTPAVVNVTVTARSKGRSINQNDQNEMDPFFGQFFGGQNPFQFQSRPRVEHGLGSGIIISPDGYIVTNNHVIENATDIHVTMNDRRVLPAKLIGADPLTDLAVIKINAGNLTSVPWGDSTALHPGQSVLAFGNPYGFRFTVTRGIVSALNRANPFSDDPRKPGEFIQTDAAINPGNSGGPLVNAHGEVVGINTFLVSESGSFSGMGFAIPSQLAKPIVASLMRYGKVDHSYIGVSISDVTPENAKFFHRDNASGAVITDVQSDTPGSRAGLKVGDVITQFNGQKVNDAGELQVAVSQQRPGTKVTLGIERDGKEMNVPVTLEALNGKSDETASSSTGHGKARWGIGISNLSPDVRDQLQVPNDVRGAVVTNVVPGSSADNAGISTGDVIVSVDRHRVQNAADVKNQLDSIPDGQDALLLVWSHGGNTFRVLHPVDGQKG